MVGRDGRWCRPYKQRWIECGVDKDKDKRKRRCAGAGAGSRCGMVISWRGGRRDLGKKQDLHPQRWNQYNDI
eukprot:scaffold8683_cov79-Skeletonema_dohrnii-CCMP3373.AAC.15